MTIVVNMEAKSTSVDNSLRRIHRKLVETKSAAESTSSSLGQIASSTLSVKHNKLPSQLDQSSAKAAKLKGSLNSLNNINLVGTNASLAQLDRTLVSISKNTGAIDRLSSSFTKLALAAGALYSVKATFVNAGDYVTGLNNKLAVVIKDSKELVLVQQELVRLSTKATTSVEGTLSTYSSLALNTRGRYVTKDLLKMTEALQLAAKISGGSEESVQAAMIQFSQAVGGNFEASAGELNSIKEQAPRLAIAIADGIGVTVADLKKLAEDGKLSTDKVLAGLMNQLPVLQEEFSRLEKTSSSAFATMLNNIKLFAGQVSRSLGIPQYLSKKFEAYGNLFMELSFVIGEDLERLKKVLAGKLASLKAGLLSVATFFKPIYMQLGSLAEAVMNSKVVGALKSVFSNMLSVVASNFSQLRSFLAENYEVFQAFFLNGLLAIESFIKSFEAIDFDISPFLTGVSTFIREVTTALSQNKDTVRFILDAVSVLSAVGAVFLAPWRMLLGTLAGVALVARSLVGSLGEPVKEATAHLAAFLVTTDNIAVDVGNGWMASLSKTVLENIAAIDLLLKAVKVLAAVGFLFVAPWRKAFIFMEAAAFAAHNWLVKIQDLTYMEELEPVWLSSSLGTDNLKQTAESFAKDASELGIQVAAGIDNLASSSVLDSLVEWSKVAGEILLNSLLYFGEVLANLPKILSDAFSSIMSDGSSFFSYLNKNFFGIFGLRLSEGLFLAVVGGIALFSSAARAYFKLPLLTTLFTTLLLPLVNNLEFGKIVEKFFAGFTSLVYSRMFSALADIKTLSLETRNAILNSLWLTPSQEDRLLQRMSIALTNMSSSIGVGILSVAGQAVVDSSVLSTLLDVGSLEELVTSYATTLGTTLLVTFAAVFSKKFRSVLKLVADLLFGRKSIEAIMDKNWASRLVSSFAILFGSFQISGMILEAMGFTPGTISTKSLQAASAVISTLLFNFAGELFSSKRAGRYMSFFRSGLFAGGLTAFYLADEIDAFLPTAIKEGIDAIGTNLSIPESSLGTLRKITYAAGAAVLGVVADSMITSLTSKGNRAALGKKISYSGVGKALAIPLALGVGFSLAAAVESSKGSDLGIAQEYGLIAAGTVAAGLANSVLSNLISNVSFAKLSGKAKLLAGKASAKLSAGLTKVIGAGINGKLRKGIGGGLTIGTGLVGGVLSTYLAAGISKGSFKDIDIFGYDLGTALAASIAASIVSGLATSLGLLLFENFMKVLPKIKLVNFKLLGFLGAILVAQFLSIQETGHGITKSIADAVVSALGLGELDGNFISAAIAGAVTAAVLSAKTKNAWTLLFAGLGVMFGEMVGQTKGLDSVVADFALNAALALSLMPTAVYRSVAKLALGGKVVSAIASGSGFSQIARTLGPALLLRLSVLGAVVSQALSYAFSGTGFFQASLGDSFWTSLADVLTSTLGAAALGFSIGGPIGAVVLGLAAALTTLMIELDLVQPIIEFGKNLAQEFKTLFTKGFWATNVGQWLSGLIDSIRAGMASVYLTIKESTVGLSPAEDLQLIDYRLSVLKGAKDSTFIDDSALDSAIAQLEQRRNQLGETLFGDLESRLQEYNTTLATYEENIAFIKEQGYGVAGVDQSRFEGVIYGMQSEVEKVERRASDAADAVFSTVIAASNEAYLAGNTELGDKLAQLVEDKFQALPSALKAKSSEWTSVGEAWAQSINEGLQRTFRAPSITTIVNPANATRRAGGGSVWGKGTATSDSIPALLSNGEFVVRTAVATKYRKQLEQMNRSGVARFKDGGSVGVYPIKKEEPEWYQGTLDVVVDWWNGTAKETASATTSSASSPSGSPSKDSSGSKKESTDKERPLLLLNAQQALLYESYEKEIEAKKKLLKTLTLGSDAYNKTAASIRDMSSQLELMNNSASEIRSSFSENLASFLKGTMSFKDAILGFYDVITSKIIDKFSKGLTDTIFDNLGLDQMFTELFQGASNLGSSAGMALGKQLGNTPMNAMWTRSADAGAGLLPQLGGLTPKAGGGLFSGLFGGIGKLFTGLFGFAEGGLLAGRGTGTSDSMLARVSNGEYIVNAAATKQWLPLLETLNKGGSLPAFASGGQVGPSNSAAFKAAITSNQDNSKTQQIIHVNVTGDVSMQTRKEIARMIPEITAGVHKHTREKGSR